MNPSVVEHKSKAASISQEPGGTEWASRRSPPNADARELAMRAGACSVRGSRRTVNEDCFYCDHAGLFLVADGMGGMRSGEIASRMAVDVISRRIGIERLRRLPVCNVMAAVNVALMEANREILAAGERDPTCRGMGTTVVVGLQLASQFCIAHIGDSRAYRMRDGVLEHLTVDHTMAQILLDAGTITCEEAARHGWRHVLWNALGSLNGDCRPDLRVLDLRRGDRFLLATDGLSNAISDEEIEQTICSFADPSAAAQQLVSAAARADAGDDATCVVIYVDLYDSN